MLIDCHNHTHNSPDGAEESVLCRCARAAELGIGVLAVTDHCEVNRFFSLAHYGVEPNGYDTYDFGRDFELSMQENTAAKAKAPEGVKLLCGIELGQATHELALAEHIYADVRLDFVIGSMHQLPGWDDFAFLDYSKVDAAALFHENLQEIARLARTDTYDVLGHITYALRYMAAAGVQLELAPYREELAEIFRILIAKDKGIEINTSGLRQAYGDCFPNLECLKLYRELGGKILTIGSDAHTNADLGKGIPRGLEIAREAGFTEITYFEKHEPQFIRLADLLD
ncbi:histidinol-phosphatase HisJ family protein [Ruminococcus sp.]|uniref:histidinol-phosphatase HisJ family protein n=1 Tax=Ruminococcus sp. TaxID=41978 RepID=UPI0025CDC5D9|nr:histidinol-phosphatase HisJ family protein [Ruminococcus sp.]MDD7556712.1 histidinol-phosphatase HisJ family protein [Ruminococcus sp.]MDY4963318.1 histidinol-phosphatase HisJ family protein [Ruminococcus callidus]